MGVDFSFRKVYEINFYHFPYVAHRYPGSTFMDHVLRYQDTPGVKMIVVLGEVSETTSLSEKYLCVVFVLGASDPVARRLNSSYFYCS